MNGLEQGEKRGGLEPQLLQNQEESDLWLRRKRWLLAVPVAAAPLIVLLVPSESIGWAIIATLVVVGLGMGYCELQRMRIFRRDVRQRKQG